MNTLKGKVAFVAGGARGIRAAIALRLTQEGVNVAFTFIRSEERAQNHGGLCAYCADIDWRTSSAVVTSRPRPAIGQLARPCCWSWA